MMKIRYVFGLLLGLGCTVCWASDEGGFASLKKKAVNWRTGPGERYPIEWIYQEQGYPVKILDTYDTWRQVQEADGSIGWVHQKMLSNKRTVLVEQEGLLTDKPRAGARTVAVVERGTVARIVRCPTRERYCLLAFSYQGKEIKGWFPRPFVWGIKAGESID